MDLLVVELRVLSLSFANGDTIDCLGLMFKDICNENVLAHILGQATCLLDFYSEEDFSVQELIRLINKIIIVHFFSIQGAWPVGALDLTSLASLTVSIGGENRWLSLALNQVLEVLQLQVALADENRLGRIPERIVLLIEGRDDSSFKISF